MANWVRRFGLIVATLCIVAGCGGGSSDEHAKDSSAGADGAGGAGGAGGADVVSVATTAGRGSSVGGRSSVGGNVATGGSSSLGGTLGTGGTAQGGTGGTTEQVDPITVIEIPKSGSAIGSAYVGDLTFTTDTQMTTFCQSYNGVIGAVSIEGGTIVNLDALSCLVEVTGKLEITATHLVTANLPKLVAAGSLALTPSKLTTLYFPTLATVRGELGITSDSLTQIELPALRAVKGSVLIASMTTLTSIRLPALTHIGMEANFSNSQLKELSLPALLYVGGSLVILTPNSTLEHMSLKSIVRVDGILSIAGGSYADINLSSLQRVGTLAVYGNAQSVDALNLSFPVLSTVGKIDITGLPNLEQVVFSTVPELDYLDLDACPSLTKLSFPELTRVQYYLTLKTTSAVALDFPKLSTISTAILGLGHGTGLRLPALTTVTKSIEVNEPVGVVEFPELVTLENGRFGDIADILGTPAQGFSLSAPKLTTAGSLGLEGALKEFSLPQLTACRAIGFTNTWLTSITHPIATFSGFLSFVSNAQLESVSLPNLTSISGLSLSDSPALTSFELPKLATATTGVSIALVPLLTTVNLPALTTTEKISFLRTEGTTGFLVPKLTRLNTLRLDTTGFEVFELPSLTNIETTLSVQNNSLLKTFSLPNAVGTSLLVASLNYNKALTSIQLPAIHASSFLQVTGNRALLSLVGLEGLVQTTTLFITDNTVLSDLVGLGNLETISGDLSLYANPALTTDTVNAFVSGVTTISGKVILTAP